MRVAKKKKTDYDAISRCSVRKDFVCGKTYGNQIKTPQAKNYNKITILKNSYTQKEYKRIAAINPTCMYAKYARYFVGKAVRLVSDAGMENSTTGWYAFIHDDDRKALNQAAGWSDEKKQYLLERPKFR